MLGMYVAGYNKVQDVKEGFGRFVAKHVKALRDDKSGATAIEYGLIAAGIAVALITVLFTLGDTIEAFFTGVDTKIKSKTPT